jgi:hypothetical protein
MDKDLEQGVVELEATGSGPKRDTPEKVATSGEGADAKHEAEDAEVLGPSSRTAENGEERKAFSAEGLRTSGLGWARMEQAVANRQRRASLPIPVSDPLVLNDNSSSRFLGEEISKQGPKKKGVTSAMLHTIGGASVSAETGPSRVRTIPSDLERDLFELSQFDSDLTKLEQASLATLYKSFEEEGRGDGIPLHIKPTEVFIGAMLLKNVLYTRSKVLSHRVLYRTVPVLELSKRFEPCECCQSKVKV